MPNPHWMELEPVERMKATEDPALGPIHTMVIRHESLEHLRRAQENAQRAFDQSVADAAGLPGVTKETLAAILDVTPPAVTKAVNRAGNPAVV